MWNPFDFTSNFRTSVDEEILEKEVQQPFSTVPPVVEPSPLNGVNKPITQKPRLLTTAEMVKYYGDPGDPDNHITITCPYPMRIEWTPNKTTTRVAVHKKVAPHLSQIFLDLLNFYGYERLRQLDIDLFGGLGNFRPQRGLEKKYEAAIKAKNFTLAITYLSRHSWWCAIDLSTAKNGLKTKWKAAQFSKPEYKPMVDIFHKNYFIGYGPERNFDAMHWEIGIIIP